MSFSAKILADSLSPAGTRLVTYELEYPRIIHAEVLTHRIFARNASSSRAIPTKRLLDKGVYIPDRFGKNQSGMATADWLPDDANEEARRLWTEGVDYCQELARKLAVLGVGKGWANRPLEWAGHIQVVLSGTEFSNYFNLRYDKQAQPEIVHLAGLMLDLYTTHEPTLLREGEWHLPYILPEERLSLPIGALLKISTARCARVSYWADREGLRDVAADMLLHDDRLLPSRHMSCFEHPARALAEPRWVGPFRGFEQYRKTIACESGAELPLPEPGSIDW